LQEHIDYFDERGVWVSTGKNSEVPDSNENTIVHERLAGAVGHPSRVSRLTLLKRSLAGFPGGTLKNFG